MWAPPPTIVSGELEDEGPVASQSGRGMQISKRGSALRRPQSPVLPPFSKFSSLWLTPSEAWTLVRGWALGQGRTPGCPMSGRGEGQKWSETGPRPRRLWTQMVRRRPGDSEQRKGQTRERRRLWGTKDLWPPGPLMQYPTDGQRETQTHGGLRGPSYHPPASSREELMAALQN